MEGHLVPVFHTLVNQQSCLVPILKLHYQNLILHIELLQTTTLVRHPKLCCEEPKTFPYQSIC